MKIFLKILLIVLWVSLAAGAVVLMGFSNRNHEVKPCAGLLIRMDVEGRDPLLTTADLRKQLVARFGDFEKKTIDEVNLEALIRFLRKNPSLDQVDAYVSIEGKLIIEVQQCQPLVRLISASGQNLYMDIHGKILPANPAYPVRVVVANGAFVVPVKVGMSIYPENGKKTPAFQKHSTLSAIHSLAGMMASDSVLNALIEQIYIKPDGSIRLATKAGLHSIEFGDTSDAAEKFENLKTFYKYGLPRTGWQKYKVINLMYKNQVVCSK
jgi:cell division protein FtsQ